MDGNVLSPLTMGCIFRFALYLYLLAMPLCDGMLTIKSCDDKKDNEMMWINSYQIFVWFFKKLLITGIHSRDRTPPNSAAELPCSNSPLPDHVYFDETSTFGENWILIVMLLKIFWWILEYLQGFNIDLSRFGYFCIKWDHFNEARLECYKQESPSCNHAFW